MSAASDKYEKDVANNINKIPGVVADRPSVGTQYADVRMMFENKQTWLEVKMSHTDNLSNPRMFYSAGRWQTTYKTPTAAFAVELLNRSPQTKQFVKDIAKYSGIPMGQIMLPTTKGPLSKPGAVPLHVMKSYFDQPRVNRYIAEQTDVDMGKLVTEHYTKGKAEPAYYMQAGDDFYRISNKDPFKLGSRIPLLQGKGVFKVRVATRSDFYEIQAEIKIMSMPKSKFSLAPKTTKKNPFIRNG